MLRLSYFVLIAFLVTGCSASRFYTKQTLKLDIKKGTRKVLLQDLTLFTTPELHNNCLSQNKSTDTGLVLQLYCSSELLARHDLSKPLRKYAIKLYNNSLFSLLKMSESQQGHQSTVNIVHNVSSQFVYSKEMNALDTRLQPKIFGEIGVAIVTFRENTTKGLDLYYPLEGIFNSASFVVSEIKVKDDIYHINVESIPYNNRKKLITFGTQLYSLKYSPGTAF